MGVYYLIELFTDFTFATLINAVNAAYNVQRDSGSQILELLKEILYSCVHPLHAQYCLWCGEGKRHEKQVTPLSQVTPLISAEQMPGIIYINIPVFRVGAETFTPDNFPKLSICECIVFLCLHDRASIKEKYTAQTVRLFERKH